MSLFKHTKQAHITQNINDLHDETLTFGDHVADRVAATMGSWPFVIVQSIILAFWIVINTIAWINHYDPYPYILLNLMLSFQAAYAAPFIMISQNRQAAKDRLAAGHDYQVNLKNENRLVETLAHLGALDNALFRRVGKREEE